MDDMTLLREYATGHSEAAFEELVKRRIGFVYSAALRQVREPHLAEEVTQAVFVILAQKAGKISGGGWLRRPRRNETEDWRRGVAATNLVGWLFKTTRFTALAQSRAAARRLRQEKEVQMQTEFQSAVAAEIWNQMSPLLDEALAALGGKDRQAVLLRFFENKSLVEVGSSLGMGEDAARKRVGRALEKLHRYFNRRGISSTTAIIAGEISANSIQAAPAVLAKSVTAVAVAKGTAAGSSTLTLIKGALKLMAWTKMKSAIVIGAGILLAAGTTTVMVEGRIHSRTINDSFWNDDPKALNAVPPLVILRSTHFSANRAGGILLPENGKLAIRHEPFDVLLAHAFNWSPARMVVKTKLPEGFFDYLVTLPLNQEEALQKKIREEFGIVGRHEVLDTKVYLVKAVGKTAAGIKPPRPGSYEKLDPTNGVVKGPLSQLWFTLESYLHVPVEPVPGLDEQHDVEFQWNQLRHEPAPGTKVDVDKLKRLMRDQLGLELITTNMPVKMLVVERAK